MAEVPNYLSQPQEQQRPQEQPFHDNPLLGYPYALMRNRKYVKAGTTPNDYNADLPLDKEAEFRQWVQQNNIPFDPSLGVSDYDMRGYWLALKAGDPRTTRKMNNNDHSLHFDDYWKTPFHKSFSADSQWANQNAPRWNELDQLVNPTGQVVFDERAKNQIKAPYWK